jgi:GAF domain-containing protein
LSGLTSARDNDELDPRIAEVVHRPSRLHALAALEANAESSAEALDRITRMACRMLDVPVALVNLIGSDRQTFMGCGSLPEPWSSMREMPITAGWCPFALDEHKAYVFADARTEPELANNPAAERLGVVAYAGVPLRTNDGEAIGTLCALDYKRHDWTDDELELMTDLAAGALAELQLLTASRLMARNHTRLQALESVSCALADATSPDDVLAEVLRGVERTNAGALWRLEDDDSALRTAATAGAGSDVLAGDGPVSLDAPLAHAQVARDGEATFLPSHRDVREGFALDADPDVGAVALLPVTAGGHRIGVLGACFHDEQRFTVEDHEYLAALAGISGLALARAG